MSPINITQHFLQQVGRTPDKPAVDSQLFSFTYRDLDHLSSQIAQEIDRKSPDPKRPVMLLMDRCPQMVIGLLATIRSGRVCIPMFLGDDPGRILSVHRAHDSPLCLIVRPEPFDAAGSPIDSIYENSIDIGEVDPSQPYIPPPHNRSSSDLAFIIYTSGSTGEPKGVMHTEDNILQNIFWYAETYGIGPNDTSLLLSSCAHISGIVGMLRPLVTGGSIFQYNILNEGFNSLVVELNRRKITLMPVVPSIFRHFCSILEDEDTFQYMRMIIMGGEAASRSDVALLRKHFSKKAVLLHTLGCTELPTYRSFPITSETQIEEGRLPAGYSSAGKEVILIDQHGQPVADGEQGEIVISSPYLAQGYWNRPEETKLRFFTSKEGKRCYRTGDLGRLTSDGLLVCGGRSDWQINSNGIRLEPEEIERALMDFDGVSAAAVRQWKMESTGSVICAYLVGAGSGLAREVESIATTQLPSHLVPNLFIQLPALPLNRSGKLDRYKLPSPEDIQTDSLKDQTPAIPEKTEFHLLKVFCDLFGRDDIGVNVSFFDAGGDSLKATLVCARIENLLGITLSPRQLFLFPSARLLGARIDAGIEESEDAHLVQIQEGDGSPPLHFLHGMGGMILTFLELIKVLGPDLPCRGLQIGYGTGQIEKFASLEQLAECYASEIVVKQEHGPYFLCGYSMGGIVALATAQCLIRKGHEVAFLGIIDTNIRNLPKVLHWRQTIPYLYSRIPLHLKKLLKPGESRLAYLRGRISAIRFLLARKRHGSLPDGADLKDLPDSDPISVLVDDYTATPFKGPIDLFLAEETRFNLPLAWKSIALQELRIHQVKGGHLELLHGPCLSEFSSVFAGALAKAKRASSGLDQ